MSVVTKEKRFQASEVWTVQADWERETQPYWPAQRDDGVGCRTDWDRSGEQQWQQDSHGRDYSQECAALARTESFVDHRQQGYHDHSEEHVFVQGPVPRPFKDQDRSGKESGSSGHRKANVAVQPVQPTAGER